MAIGRGSTTILVSCYWNFCHFFVSFQRLFLLLAASFLIVNNTWDDSYFQQGITRSTVINPIVLFF